MWLSEDDCVTDFLHLNDSGGNDEEYCKILLTGRGKGAKRRKSPKPGAFRCPRTGEVIEDEDENHAASRRAIGRGMMLGSFENERSLQRQLESIDSSNRRNDVLEHFVEELRNHYDHTSPGFQLSSRPQIPEKSTGVIPKTSSNKKDEAKMARPKQDAVQKKPVAERDIKPAPIIAPRKKSSQNALIDNKKDETEMERPNNSPQKVHKPEAVQMMPVVDKDNKPAPVIASRKKSSQNALIDNKKDEAEMERSTNLPQKVPKPEPVQRMPVASKDNKSAPVIASRKKSSQNALIENLLKAYVDPITNGDGMGWNGGMEEGGGESILTEFTKTRLQTNIDNQNLKLGERSLGSRQSNQGESDEEIFKAESSVGGDCNGYEGKPFSEIKSATDREIHEYKMKLCKNFFNYGSEEDNQIHTEIKKPIRVDEDLKFKKTILTNIEGELKVEKVEREKRMIRNKSEQTEKLARKSVHMSTKPKPSGNGGGIYNFGPVGAFLGLSTVSKLCNFDEEGDENRRPFQMNADDFPRLS